VEAEQDLRGHEEKTTILDMEKLGDEGYGSSEGTNLNENLITMQTCMSAMTLREEEDEQRSIDTQTSHQKSFELELTNPEEHLAEFSSN